MIKIRVISGREMIVSLIDVDLIWVRMGKGLVGELRVSGGLVRGRVWESVGGSKELIRNVGSLS